jgi:uncharacterized protein (UPF0276 family)
MFCCDAMTAICETTNTSAGNGRDGSSADMPPAAGVGLKPQHYDDILDTMPDIGWFEIHAENYMGAGGAPHRFLHDIRARYPLSLHGVGLSIGGAAPLDKDHLARLKAVHDRYEPALFSEHLAWSTHGSSYYPDLLPLPYTGETLGLVSDHIDEVQNALGRAMLLENPATYLAFETNTMGELDFLSEVVRRTGCGLLLDINNVFVSATNQGYGAEAYLDEFPISAVGEIHLAGHAPDTDETGAPLLIDTHDRQVSGPVWELFRRTITRTGPLPTLIEWDSDVPAWPVLFAEAKTVDAVLRDMPVPENAHAIAG